MLEDDSPVHQGVLFRYLKHLLYLGQFIILCRVSRYSRMQPGWRHHYEIIRQVFFTVPYYFSLRSLTANQSSEDDRFGNDGHLQLDP